jgi:hypothetical protein
VAAPATRRRVREAYADFPSPAPGRTTLLRAGKCNLSAYSSAALRRIYRHFGRGAFILCATERSAPCFAWDLGGHVTPEWVLWRNLKFLCGNACGMSRLQPYTRKVRSLQVPVGEPIENRRLRVKIIGSGLLYGNFAVYVRKRIESKGSRRGGFFRADPSHASKGGSRGNPGTRRTLRCGGRQGSALRSARCAARSTIPHEQRPLVREPWPTRGLD